MASKKNIPLLHELNEVGSTNNYAMGWIQGKALPNGHKELINGMSVQKLNGPMICTGATVKWAVY